MKRFIYLSALLVLAACQAPQVKQPASLYPNISSYFKQEVNRLQQQKPPIEKTVNFNKESETKNTRQINWEEELSLFSQSDINKPAFKGLYQIEKQGKETVFTALQEKLKTREIRISYTASGEISRITIKNHSTNALYTSDEFLEYCPDSLYQIIKRQEVKVLGTSNYKILGKFKE